MLSLELYAKLYLARRAEEKIREHYGEDEMKTPMHMSMGEEAIAIGVSHALRPDDQIFATYRSHALFLARTDKVEDFFAEMYGKETALLKGKGGSMHLCAPEFGFMGSSAIVASNIPVGLGAAFAKKRQGNGNIAAVFFGDGAADEGSFWESLNAACLMKLPVLFVCEDNGLAVHTPAPLRQGYRSLTKVVSKFNCSLLSSSTTDVESIYQLTRQAIDLITDKKIPCFMHLKYYRYLEHVGVNEDFAAGYRSRKEFEEWLKVDPVKLQRQKLLRQGVTEADLAKLEREIDDRVERSLNLAQQAPFAEDGELYRSVLAE
ncbi:MAG: thiamine pyrophosphate-dependent dehydrogenase E1 component subunit alpha [Chloroflexi bacterium]|nr:thiamine pyrophosphate-dependent dehydrogenase E1 component subunit alpha [Chloroflexota bacterium]